ncbi:hypothetical protein RUM43_013876 [Polyplax serrata]|uniref:Vps16 C-terminal domain-containing protein n=1 Tax=Polyplax serrata TaxID=468196 RepID=A0AAN8S682_POLSC
MSSKQEDENYWNHSESKAFSFDDDELGSNSRLFGAKVKSSFVADIIFEGVPQKPDLEQRPLETLISSYSLQRIFEEKICSKSENLSVQEELKLAQRQLSNQWVPLSVSKTVNLIALGQPYSLHLYRSLELKKALLDEAIKSGDGNGILTVVIFLSNTLKKSLFYQILQTRPVAVAQYVQYLTSRVMVSDLIDLLEMLGQTRDAGMKQFEFIIQGIQNKKTKLQRLNTCYSNHFSLLDSNDKYLLKDYINFLEWTLTIDETGTKSSMNNSVLDSLAYLCTNHWDEPKTSKTSPWFLSAMQNISERQFQWVILLERSQKQCWADIETHFLTKGWLSGKKLKGIISIEKIIVEMCKHEAPYNVLEKYFEVIGNYDKRLEVAKQVSCHKAVIDTLVLMKDRQGIIDYKMNLKPQSEEYLHAESVLRNQIKWKN